MDELLQHLLEFRADMRDEFGFIKTDGSFRDVSGPDSEYGEHADYAKHELAVRFKMDADRVETMDEESAVRTYCQETGEIRYFWIHDEEFDVDVYGSITPGQLTTIMKTARDVPTFTFDVRNKNGGGGGSGSSVEMFRVYLEKLGLLP